MHSSVMLLFIIMLFQVYFVAAFFLSEQIFVSKAESLKEIQIFFQRETCLANFFVYVREDFVRM